MIQQRQNESEKHLHYADDDGKLHLKRIGERNGITAHLPRRIQAERIRIAAKHFHGRIHGQIVRIEVERGPVLERKVIANAHAPRRSEYIDRLGEDVIVNDTRVDAKNAHKQDDVAASVEYLPHLVVLELVL